MRSRLPLLALLASALTFLVSLFLPWIGRTVPSTSALFISPQAIGTLFEGGHLEGWVSGAGDVAVLLVIAVVLAAVAALRSPELAARLPIGSLSVALGYFAAAVAVEVHTLSPILIGGFTGSPPRASHTTWTYGSFLGLAVAGIAVLSGLAYRRRELLRPPPGAADAIGLILGLALLGAFLLPWIGVAGHAETHSPHGIENPAAAIAVLALILGGSRLQREAGRRWRLAVAIAIAVLTGGAASAIGLVGTQLYGAWIGVGLAVSLVAVEASRAWPVRLPVLPRGLAMLRVGAAAALIVALFLPWQELRDAGVNGGTDGWYSPIGAAAGAVCLLLLATQALPVLETYVLDAVVASVVFVSVLATTFREESVIYRIGYGAFVGIAAAGVLLIATVAPLRPGRVDPRRALVRAVPLAASVLCVAAVVVPAWFVLPEGWTYEAVPLYGFFSATGVLVGLYLVRLWVLQVRGPGGTPGRLTLVPLVLLTLASLELIRFRKGEVIWGAVILVGLCLLLAVLGWIEESGGGLESFRVPDAIWRVDRLPEIES
jgi:hypothetical protein